MLRIYNRRARLFEQYERMAYDVAKSFHKKTGVPYHELAEEALEHLGVELTTRLDYFDDTKSSRTTWVYQAIYWQLMVYCTKKRKRRTLPLEVEKVDQPEPVTWLGGLLQELGDEGRGLVRIVCEAPAELAEVLSHRAPTRSREAVRRYLAEKEQWPEDKIDRAWREVEACLV